MAAYLDSTVVGQHQNDTQLSEVHGLSELRGCMCARYDIRTISVGIRWSSCRQMMTSKPRKRKRDVLTIVTLLVVTWVFVNYSTTLWSHARRMTGVLLYCWLSIIFILFTSITILACFCGTAYSQHLSRNEVVWSSNSLVHNPSPTLLPLWLHHAGSCSGHTLQTSLVPS